MPNNGNGAGNLAGAAGGDRWADRKIIVQAIRESLAENLTDAEVRAYFRVKEIEPKMRARMARHKAEIIYDTMIALFVEAATEKVTSPFTGWAWKNGAVIWLENARFSGLVWSGGKWVQRTEKTGLNLPGLMRAGLFPAERLNMTACNAMGARLADFWAGEPFKVPAMKNGAYASALHSRSGWATRKAHLLAAGWKLPTDAGFYGDTGIGDVFIVYGPIEGAAIGDMVSVPWVNNLMQVYQIQKVLDWERAHPLDDDGKEYQWAWGPYQNPPFVERVRWRAFPAAVGGWEFKAWLSENLKAEINK